VVIGGRPAPLLPQTWLFTSTAYTFPKTAPKWLPKLLKNKAGGAGGVAGEAAAPKCAPKKFKSKAPVRILMGALFLSSSVSHFRAHLGLCDDFLWSSGHLVIWSSAYFGSSGHLLISDVGHLVICLFRLSVILNAPDVRCRSSHHLLISVVGHLECPRCPAFIWTSAGI
jgi:hypothetical protein